MTWRKNNTILGWTLLVEHESSRLLFRCQWCIVIREILNVWAIFACYSRLAISAVFVVSHANICRACVSVDLTLNNSATLPWFEVVEFSRWNLKQLVWTHCVQHGQIGASKALTSSSYCCSNFSSCDKVSELIFRFPLCAAPWSRKVLSPTYSTCCSVPCVSYRHLSVAWSVTKVLNVEPTRKGAPWCKYRLYTRI